MYAESVVKFGLVVLCNAMTALSRPVVILDPFGENLSNREGGESRDTFSVSKKSISTKHLTTLGFEVTVTIPFSRDGSRSGDQVHSTYTA